MAAGLPDLGAIAWALLVLAAAFSGLSKTALPGMTTLSVAIFAAVLPAKASTGALLLLLIVGDVFALLSYRRHAHWPTILRLFPAVAAGLVLGALFLAFADDSWVRRTIGIILLALIGITLWRRHAPRLRAPRRRAQDPAASDPATADPDASDRPVSPGAQVVARIGYGTLAGFTTMVANAGGPVMAMYFLAARFPVKAFLGTAAWFFAVVNLVKVPISVGLGIITPSTLLLVLVLIPGLVAGALIGRWIANRIAQRVFDLVVVIGSLAGAIYLIV